MTLNSFHEKMQVAIEMALSLEDVVEKALIKDRLSYFSPEQTGKLDVSIDYRSSYYSFGILLYEHFTGTHPIDKKDDIHAIYEHVAVTPPPMHSLDADIPQSLSAVVDKLLSKNPDERYQSEEGIVHDLKVIAENRDDDFVLGTHDLKKRLMIPETLYGRDTAIQACSDAIIQQDKMFGFVEGEPGLGKTTFLQAVSSALGKQNIFFAHVKFEESRADQTRSPIGHALSQYVQSILLLGDEQIERFKSVLSQTLEDNIGLMVKFVPELSVLFPAAEAPDELGAIEAQNRFNVTFLRIMAAVTSFDKKVVLAIDDMQWCDVATARLIEMVVGSDDILRLSVVMGYRKEALTPATPFSKLLQEFSEKDDTVTIDLAPLDATHVSKMLKDVLGRSAEEFTELSQHLLQKTGGNPFFLKGLLSSLYNQKLIFFDVEQQRWDWRLDEIIQVQISDNMVELVRETIVNIPNAVKKVLKYAAALGDVFCTEDLAAILDEDKVHLDETLQKSFRFNCIVQSGHGVYRFVHGRIQETFAGYLSSEGASVFHLKAGEYFQNKNDSSKDISFVVCAHLNKALDHITSEDKRAELIQLNLRCARLSVESNSYSNAEYYVRKAILLQGENRWSADVQLSLELSTLLAEVHYLNLNFDEAAAVFQDTIGHLDDPSDKAAIVQVQILSFIAQNKMAEALELGLETLDEFGIVLPEEDDLSVYYPTLFDLYDTDNVMALADLPEMTERGDLRAIDILNSIMAPAYLTAPVKYAKICYVAIKRCIKFGNSAASTNVYAVHALLLSAFFEEYKQSLDFARLAQSLITKYDAKAYIAKVDMIANACVLHWNDHVDQTLAPLKKTAVDGIEVGDFEYSCYSAMYHTLYALLSGQKIDPLLEEFQSQTKTMASLKQSYQILYNSLWRQMLVNLTQPCSEPTLLEGEFFKESESLEELKQTNSFSILYNFYLAKSILGLVFENTESAYEYIQAAKAYHIGVASLYQFGELYFYESLIAFREFEEQKLPRESVETILETSLKYYRTVSKTAPENTAPKISFLLGLQGQLAGKSECWKMFEAASKQAGESGFRHIQGLADLFNFYYWTSAEMPDFASVYLSKAVDGFNGWGARSVTKQLLQCYSLQSREEERKQEMTLDQYDLVSVLRASQTLSEELSVEQLLHKIMDIIIENSGSQIGLFYIETGTALELVAGYRNGTISIDIPSQELPTNLVQFVNRTKQNLIFSITQPSELIQSDEYIQRFKPKSLFCFPIWYQGEFRGILYLENRDTPNLYSKDRIELLQFLSTQATISLDHAKLFEQVQAANTNLEQQVIERTTEIEAQKVRAESALAELQQTQNQMIQSEKLAALGQLIAGIAHEINTPIGAIKSSGETIMESIGQTLEEMPALLLRMSAEEADLFMQLVTQKKDLETVRTSREERVLVRKLAKELDEAGVEDARQMASDFVALGVTEQWKTFLPLLESTDRDAIFHCAYNLFSTWKNSDNISQSVARVSKIIFALKSFAHFDNSGEMKEISLRDNIETVLTIYQNQIKQATELVRNYEDIPPIACYPDELTQVWTNLIYNALQAMDYEGTLTIGIHSDAGAAVVSIKDSGCGIADDIKDKLFNPFFTTKEQGEGSGLGLDIVQKIIEKHNGKIEIESAIGEGATFSVYLPYADKE
ncbi:MAG: ATP-binding protein [Desulfovibrio sp.]